ncbi:unnamed protein product [Caenorhabditis bovis]|uniref:Uncharacterized protein n=1 Tax=Caenorhabditis bovis TaxID=2654633 RepID=A0A8S1EXU1_9PELO|nr:unnamed protein product [Caenorhabditis bovis]
MSGKVHKNDAGFENDYGDFSKFKKVYPPPMAFHEWIYLQYILVSGIYMLEPWERKLFNSAIIIFIAIICLILRYLLF